MPHRSARRDMGPLFRRSVARRLTVWEPRIGREALEKRERGLTLFVAGWLSVLALIVLFMIGSSNDVKPLAISAAVATFAVALPIMTGGRLPSANVKLNHRSLRIPEEGEENAYNKEDERGGSISSMGRSCTRALEVIGLMSPWCSGFEFATSPALHCPA